METDQPSTAPPTAPLVSVIVPARNEEASLGRCLSSLLEQTGVDCEILVVNDGSTDRTRQIAESFLHVRVVDADPLPPGWTGKSNALWTGVQHARGKWLLFTDADTVHLPGSLQRALEEASRHRADLLSYSPKQEVHSFWERSLMPVIFAELRRMYRPKEVSDPTSPAAAANGQYLLVSREAYDRVGGHAAIASTLLEGVELAKAVKRSGRRLRFRYAADAVSTRMYPSFPQMWEGWTKNLAVLFPQAIRLAIGRSLEFAALIGGPVLAVVALSRDSRSMLAAGAAIGLAAGLNFFLRIAKAHFGVVNSLLAPLGLPIFVLLLVRSRLHYKRGKVEWKGRTYCPPGRGSKPAVARGFLTSSNQ